MFKTLSAKLTAVLLGLLCLIGVFYIALTLFSTRMYMDEANQQLNWTLAEHIVSEKILMQGQEVNKAALEELFHSLMVINPSIEIYLLDTDGAILACSAPSDQLQHTHVPLEPVHAFLKSNGHGPILGDDPLTPGGRKIFSAAVIPANTDSHRILSADNPSLAAPGEDGVSRIFIDGRDTFRRQSLAALGEDGVSRVENSSPAAGYLYVVLGGQAYDSITQMLQRSQILRLSTWVIVASVLLALLAGVLLFKLLTRRLTQLSQSMEAFRQGEFVAAGPASNMRLDPRASNFRDSDEIDRLGATFNQMAERILQQMHSLKQTDALRRELVANVSHDLRTPLASLQGYLETLQLKEGRLTVEEQRHYLEIATRHSERLGKLVSELFELAKLDAQEAPPQLEPFALGELVQDVLQELQLVAECNQVELRADFPKDLPFVCADIGLMERVLDNLIENALCYTPSGGAVSVAMARQGDTIGVRVSDTGCGIPAEDLPYVFDRFYRVEKTRQLQAGGAGLGLAIAKRILDLHGIALHVDSDINVGTAFTFRVPVHQN